MTDNKLELKGDQGVWSSVILIEAKLDAGLSAVFTRESISDA